jgi:hypothetical protein
MPPPPPPAGAEEKKGGEEAGEESEGLSKPFQIMQFLVRDWANFATNIGKPPAPLLLSRKD